MYPDMGIGREAFAAGVLGGVVITHAHVDGAIDRVGTGACRRRDRGRVHADRTTAESRRSCRRWRCSRHCMPARRSRTPTGPAPRHGRPRQRMGGVVFVTMLRLIQIGPQTDRGGAKPPNHRTDARCGMLSALPWRDRHQRHEHEMRGPARPLLRHGMLPAELACAAHDQQVARRRARCRSSDHRPSA